MTQDKAIRCAEAITEHYKQIPFVGFVPTIGKYARNIYYVRCFSEDPILSKRLRAQDVSFIASLCVTFQCHVQVTMRNDILPPGLQIEFC